MSKEYEYTFQDFNKSKIILKLNKLKGVYKGTYLFRVQHFSIPQSENSRARVRDEGFRITMTIKTATGDFDEEEEITIDNYDNGVNLLLKIGCIKKFYHEKIREIWNLNNTEIIFDTIPGHPEIMEIESKTLGELKTIIKLFNLTIVPNNKQKNLFVELFNIDMNKINKINNITFNNVKKILTPFVTKNKKYFNSLIKEQINYFKKIKNNI